MLPLLVRQMVEDGPRGLNRCRAAQSEHSVKLHGSLPLACSWSLPALASCKGHRDHIKGRANTRFKEFLVTTETRGDWLRAAKRRPGEEMNLKSHGRHADAI